MEVVLRLIKYYPRLFDVKKERLAINYQISQVQEQLMEQGNLAIKSAGDIRVWIFYEPSDQDIAVQVSLQIIIYFNMHM